MPEKGRAEVRARYMQSYLEALKARPEYDAILSGMRPEEIEACRRASSIGWVDSGVNVMLGERVYAVLGTAEADRFFAGLFSAFIETPILKTFVMGTVRLFGSDPASILKRVPTGFDLLFRNYGRWVAEQDSDTSLVLRLEDLTPPLGGHPAFAKGTRASLEPVLALARRGGSVDLVSVGPTSVVYRATWR